MLRERATDYATRPVIIEDNNYFAWLNQQARNPNYLRQVSCCLEYLIDLIIDGVTYLPHKI